MRDTQREAETQAEGEAGSMHQEPDVGFDLGSPGSRPEPKAGAKPLRHPGIPFFVILNGFYLFCCPIADGRISTPIVTQVLRLGSSAVFVKLGTTLFFPTENEIHCESHRWLL